MQKVTLRNYLTFAAVLACVAVSGVLGLNYLKDLRDKVLAEQEARKDTSCKTSEKFCADAPAKTGKE